MILSTGITDARYVSIIDKYNTDIRYNKTAITTPIFDFEIKERNLDELEKSLINNNKKTDKNKKSQGKRYAFELGIKDGDTRIVDTNSISVRIDTKNKVENDPNKDSLLRPDHKFDSSAQGKRGDCYLLAEINAIRNTKYGQAVLDSNLKWDSDGSVTVTLPGALKVRKDYLAQGLECEVTGKYHITAAALDKARGLAGDSYSRDDIEVIVYEIAVENYRAELHKTKEINGIEKSKFDSPESYSGKENDFLSGGYCFDAGFLITGEKSDVYMAGEEKRKNLKYYKKNEYGYITREEMEARTNTVKNGHMLKGCIKSSEINSFTADEQELVDMLKQYQGKEDTVAITCGFVVAVDGPDGSTKVGGGHALTVVKITDDVVYVANPWDPDKIEPIPMKDFVKMCKGLMAHEVKPPKNSTGFNNLNINSNYFNNNYTNNNTYTIPRHKFGELVA